MKLYEYESKQILDNFGLKIPKQIAVIENVEQLNNVSLSFPIIIKAMVLIGGRGKAGGVKKADNIDEARIIINEMFKLSIHGYLL